MREIIVDPTDSVMCLVRREDLFKLMGYLSKDQVLDFGEAGVRVWNAINDFPDIPFIVKATQPDPPSVLSLLEEYDAILEAGFADADNPKAAAKVAIEVHGKMIKLRDLVETDEEKALFVKVSTRIMVDGFNVTPTQLKEWTS